MKTDTTVKAYFIGYDIFGYLLPGLILFGFLAAGNQWIDCSVLSEYAPTASKDSPNIVSILVIMTAAYVIGHLIAAISSLVFEKLLLARVLKYPTERMFPTLEVPDKLELDSKEGQDCSKPTRKQQCRSAIKSVIAPGYCRVYSSGFRTAFLNKFESVFGFPADDYHDIFWLVSSYISIHHPAAYQRGTHFLNLYGFARNTSMAFLFAATIPLVPGWTGIIYWPIWCGVCLASSYFMFINYTKLIRRLNDELYRGFVTAVTASAQTCVVPVTETVA